MAKRHTIPQFIEGEEVGGVIVGRWIDPVVKLEGGEKAVEREQDKAKRWDIPINPVKGKFLGVKYSGGFVQLPNAAKNKGEQYRLPNMFYVIMRLLPLLLTVFFGNEIIGFWHSHPPGYEDHSGADKKAVEDYLLRTRKDRMLLGVGSGRKMNFWIIRNDTRNVKWDKK